MLYPPSLHSFDKLSGLFAGSRDQWRSSRTVSKHSEHMAIASPPEGGPGGPCLAWAWMDVMELAGRLAQQHAQELKEVLRLEGDRANQARTQLQALAQALHDILSSSTTTSSSEGGERGSDGARMVAQEVEAPEEVRCRHADPWLCEM
jgi:hypothetical protein